MTTYGDKKAAASKDRRIMSVGLILAVAQSGEFLPLSFVAVVRFIVLRKSQLVCLDVDERHLLSR